MLDLASNFTLRLAENGKLNATSTEILIQVYQMARASGEESALINSMNRTLQLCGSNISICAEPNSVKGDIVLVLIPSRRLSNCFKLLKIEVPKLAA